MLESTVNSRQVTGNLPVGLELVVSYVRSHVAAAESRVAVKRRETAQPHGRQSDKKDRQAYTGQDHTLRHFELWFELFPKLGAFQTSNGTETLNCTKSNGTVAFITI